MSGTAGPTMADRHATFDEVQQARQARNDAICAALADVDKGEHGLRHHRWVVTQELVHGSWGLPGGTTINTLDPVHTVEWCWDCGRNRAAAEQVPTPSALYSDHPAVGYCGYRAQQPGPWWEKPDLGVAAV